MSSLRFIVCSFLAIAPESCRREGAVDIVYRPFHEHTNSRGEERRAGIKKTVRPQPASTHWLRFPPPTVPCSRSEKVRSGPNIWEPRVTPALPFGHTPAQSTRQEVFLIETRLYTRFQTKSELLLSCFLFEIHRPPSATQGC